MPNDLKEIFAEISETFVVSFIVIFVLFTFVAFPTLVWGSSMEPDFHTGERVLVERLSKYFTGFERGNVVVLHPPEDDSADYIKRIIAMPGDVIEIFNCAVYISKNGDKFELKEPYLVLGTCTLGGAAIKDGRAVKVPNNYYVVLGDNRGVSKDSRVLGFIPKDKILGRVVFRFWPLSKFGLL